MSISTFSSDPPGVTDACRLQPRYCPYNKVIGELFHHFLSFFNEKLMKSEIFFTAWFLNLKWKERNMKKIEMICDHFFSERFFIFIFYSLSFYFNTVITLFFTFFIFHKLDTSFGQLWVSITFCILIFKTTDNHFFIFYI